VDSGARNIDHILNASILPALATEILLALSEQKLPNQIWIDVDNDEFIYVLDSKIKQSKKKKAKAVKAETV